MQAIYVDYNACSPTAMSYITRAKQSIQYTNDATNDILLCVHCRAISRNLYDANETIAILYKVSNNNPDENFREQILQFILQIKQKEVKFGIGLFYFGYDFIRRFYKSIVTVLVIIIQLRSSYINILSYYNNK